MSVENARHLLTRATIIGGALVKRRCDRRQHHPVRWRHPPRPRPGLAPSSSKDHQAPRLYLRGRRRSDQTLAHASPVVDQDGGSRIRDTARPDKRALPKAGVTPHTWGSTDRGCSRAERPVRLSVLVLPLRSSDGSEVRELLAEQNHGRYCHRSGQYLNNLAPGEARVFFDDNRLARWRTEIALSAGGLRVAGRRSRHAPAAPRACNCWTPRTAVALWSERCELLEPKRPDCPIGSGDLDRARKGCRTSY